MGFSMGFVSNPIKIKIGLRSLVFSNIIKNMIKDIKPEKYVKKEKKVNKMLFHITITDIAGIHKVMNIIANTLLDAGIIAEEQYEESLKKKKLPKSEPDEKEDIKDV